MRMVEVIPYHQVMGLLVMGHQALTELHSQEVQVAIMLTEEVSLPEEVRVDIMRMAEVSLLEEVQVDIMRMAEVSLPEEVRVAIMLMEEVSLPEEVQADIMLMAEASLPEEVQVDIIHIVEMLRAHFQAILEWKSQAANRLIHQMRQENIRIIIRN